MASNTQIHGYSIFKIENGQVSGLKKELKTKMKPTAKKQIANNTFTFYFSEKPPDTVVHWMELYKAFLPNVTQQYNHVFFGVLLVEIKRGDTFAVSLGKAHFYIEKYCNPDFGLDLAERIADASELKKKISKHLFNNKNHSSISYRENSNLSDYESGEYYRNIVSSTISESLWGKTAAFGESVHLKLPLLPSELSSLFKRIQTTLRKRGKVNIPRVKAINEGAEIAKLENKLKKYLNQAASRPSSTEILLSSKDLIMDEGECFAFLRGHKKEKRKLDDFDLQSLTCFSETANIHLGDEIDRLQLELIDEGGSRITRSLRQVIDYADDKGNCLLEGRWQWFNDSYIEYLKRFVDDLGFEYDPKQDLSNKKLQAYLLKNPTSYAEQYFNELRGSEGFTNKDRDIILIDNKYKVECMDLYKGKCLYFVKIGTAQKLSYVIDQAINTLQLIRAKQLKIRIKTSNVSPKQNCLWLIFDRVTLITKLSDIDSLIFHMKLTEWRRLCMSMNITPLIKVNYRTA